MNKNLPPRLFFLKKKNIYNYRVDSISQFLRLMTILNIDNKIEIDERLIKKLMKILVKNICRSRKKILSGGFYWGNRSNGKKTLCVNTWTTAFTLQALIYLGLIKSGKNKYLNPFHIV